MPAADMCAGRAEGGRASGAAGRRQSARAAQAGGRAGLPPPSPPGARTIHSEMMMSTRSTGSDTSSTLPRMMVTRSLRGRGGAGQGGAERGRVWG